MAGEKAMRGNARYQTEFLRSGAAWFLYLLCGVVVSRGALLGELAPFGASYAAAVPKKYLPSALLGTAFGYILLNPSNSFRYLAVVASIGALRWLMSDLEKISKSRLFAPLVAFVPVIATGAALLFSSTSTLSSFSDCVIEAILAGTAAYFINVATTLAGENRSLEAYSPQETASLVMTGCVLILALGSIRFENISLGRIAAVVVILLCSRYGGATGGAISGISTGSVFSLASRAQGFVCGGYAFGGLMSGLFSATGKLGCAISFVAANGVMALAFGENTVFSGVLIESFIGSAIFMILPKELGNIISPVFSNEKNISLAETLRKNIVMRLDFVSRAIYNVRNDVNTVSEKLKRLCEPSFETVCNKVENEVCKGCGLKMYCYEHKQGVTRDDFFRLEQLLEEQGEISERDVETAFVKNCCKKGEIACSMNKSYKEYLASLEAQRRVSDVRSVVAGQFSGVSDILNDLSKEFKNTMRSDPESAQRIISSLQALGIIVCECVCLVGGGGHMSVELVLSNKSEGKISKGSLMREISKCCGRTFDLPTLTREGDRVRAALCEMPVYGVEIGTDQHIANGGKLCGDCLEYFNDGFGNAYAVIGDGMGTGGRAAVDGNMAVSVMGRLLRSGLGADSALQIVNSALMVKSDDESLSTLDVFSLDLYSGAASIRKAGAPTTFVKKRGRVIPMELPSLPVGILNGVKFSSDTIKLGAGDMIVMVSDGVVTGDEKWLERLIRTWNEGSISDLAAAVVDEAVKRRKDGRDDDITALAIKVVDKAEVNS